MIISGANNLENNKHMVNSLNIFPVPDGDTGTNMSLTMTSAVKEINSLKDFEIHNVFEAAANGTLMGARGNSGVILSQIFRGLAKGVKTHNDLSVAAVADSFMEGSNTAYKAIMKPTEGTILTVIRETAEFAIKEKDKHSDLIEFFELLIKKANEVLDKTPDLLPVLKNAGVVDAGGKGLICIFDGMLHALKTNSVLMLIEGGSLVDEEQPMAQEYYSTEDITFGYCTEFFIKTGSIDLERYKDTLRDMGDSQVVVGGAGIVKVHIHTNNPGKVLEMALEHGELSKIKIDNMREQHRELLVEIPAAPVLPAEPQRYGVVAVAMGEGIAGIFKDLGVDEIIEGGQTMNPSTEDIVKSINKINAENIIILPNNSNIILAANQAKSLSEKNVIVAATKTIPQGIAALMALDFDKIPEDNTKKIEKSISSVKTGLITYAVRNSTYDDINIEEGNILGLVEGKINSVAETVPEVFKELLEKMVDEDSSLVSIYYGKETSKEEAEMLAAYVQETYPECEVDMHFGGQPLYYYIISVE
ncbi:MAG TPA: DAK2 domain-containing protein [Patescibacteria group bacterium]|nr:DAK2 domain-containing protein [Patescibacteria group bacterium]